MHWSKSKLFAFIALALVALAVHFFLYEMRYMWHLQPDDYLLLRVVYAGCLVAIVALWLFFPSRTLVGLISFFALFFPHLLYASNTGPLMGREIDIPGIGVALVSVALFVAATELRRRAIAA
jgi:hypothetical protein